MAADPLKEIASDARETFRLLMSGQITPFKAAAGAQHLRLALRSEIEQKRDAEREFTEQRLRLRSVQLTGDLTPAPIKRGPGRPRKR